MKYQVWTKGDYEGWLRKDCQELVEVQVEVLAALKRGLEPLITQELAYQVEISIKEVPDNAVTETQTQTG